MKHIAYIILPLILACQGCREEFADLNTPPDKITVPQLNQLFTEGLAQLYPHDYHDWFYNYSQYYLPWSQATVAVRGNKPELNFVSDYSPPENKLFGPKLQFEEIRYQLNQVYTPEAAAPFRYLEAACNPLLVYLGLYGTDFYGSLAYSEASKAPFTQPPLITPRYETQQELFEVWLGELDATLQTLTHPVTVNDREYKQASPGSQDFIYGGDFTKWARLANSLKLKVAVRMLNSDRTRALQIAGEVADSPAGIMESIDHDFLYCRGAEFYNFNNPVENLGTGNQTLIDFLVHHKDPRVRFLYAKNDFNSQVVQAFFDAGKEVPSYILNQVDYTESAGRKHFENWKSPGEPWVRYYGAPVDIQATKDPVVNATCFNPENFKLPDGNGTKSYQPLSLYNEEMTRGNAVYTFPSPPGATTFQDEAAHPFYAVLCSSAETHLYLAELKLAGADLPQSAEYYYRKGIEFSVRLLNRLAGLNKIPYYEPHPGFDPLDATIALQENEITSLLAAYSLTGTTPQQLEQVYLQLYIHHLYTPNELLVTVRRTGYPRTGSTLLAWQAFDSSNPTYPIPRRLPVPIPSPTDQMQAIKSAAFSGEGFTPGSNTPQTLNTQRVWYDKNAPDYGNGM